MKTKQNKKKKAKKTIVSWIFLHPDMYLHMIAPNECFS